MLREDGGIKGVSGESDVCDCESERACDGSGTAPPDRVSTWSRPRGWAARASETLATQWQAARLTRHDNSAHVAARHTGRRGQSVGGAIQSDERRCSDDAVQSREELLQEETATVSSSQRHRHALVRTIDGAATAVIVVVVYSRTLARTHSLTHSRKQVA